MESSFLFERRIISLNFNSLKNSVFILSLDKNGALQLTEEDISKNIILQRFKPLKNSECNIQTPITSVPNSSFEGYRIYFWELTNTLFLIYPFGYITIFDCSNGQIIFHFQAHGKRKTYPIRSIVASPIEKCFFISAQSMRNVYFVNYDNIPGEIEFMKLRFPEHIIIFDVICHPREKYVFTACSDSLIRVYDYSENMKIKEAINGIVDIPLAPDGSALRNQYELIKKANLHAVLTIDINPDGNLLLSGNENGFIYLWDAFAAMKQKRVLIYKEHISLSGILSLKFIRTEQFQDLGRFIVLTKEGKFNIFSIINKEKDKGNMFNDPNNPNNGPNQPNRPNPNER
ncbi:MAG: hypothetical protein MJ252_27210, partial [archaeon]|nr:hypothetical protein [archaeon]